MPDTFVKIASVTVGSGGASSIDFTSIPSTYTDLVVKISARVTSTSPEMTLKFNGVATSQTDKLLYNYAGSVGSNGSAPVRSAVSMSSQTANTFGNAEIYIPNYTSSNYKSSSVDAVPEGNATGTYQSLCAALWSNTAAINRITITSDGNIAQYSTAYLYGIKSS